MRQGGKQMAFDYRVAPGGPCLSCGYGQDTVEHYRIHVPANRWPASMQRKHVERVVVDGLVYDKGHEPGAVSGATVAPASTVLADVDDGGTATAPETATLAALMRGHVDDDDEPRGQDYLHGDATVSDNPLTCIQCGRVSGSLTGARSHERAHQRAHREWSG